MYINEKREITDKTLYRNTLLNVFITIINICIVILFFFLSCRFQDVKPLYDFYFSLVILWSIITITGLKILFVKYEITEEGLYVKYPLESKKLLKWNVFQQVCVCYHHNKGVGGYVVICCIKHGEKRSFWTNRWKTDSLFHHRSVITIDYTYELYETFKKMCPYEIIDLRETDDYRIFTLK